MIEPISLRNWALVTAPVSEAGFGGVDDVLGLVTADDVWLAEDEVAALEGLAAVELALVPDEVEAVVAVVVLDEVTGAEDVGVPAD